MSYFPIINNNDYDFELPKEKIPEYPLPVRSQSKLLIVNKNTNELHEDIFANIDCYLPNDSLIIWNKSKVIAARMFFKKETGANIELLCLEPEYPSKEPNVAMSAGSGCIWKCMVGGRHVKPDMVLHGDFSGLHITATVLSKDGSKADIKFEWLNDGLNFSQVLEHIGRIPLPPYIKRESEESDKKRYQTVYAEQEGSIAAPTAGLHFDDGVIHKLCKKNIEIAEILLNVGAGTFVPMNSNNPAEHNMHSELVEITVESLQKILKYIIANKSITCVGTTSVRTIESLYYLALKLKHQENVFNSYDEFIINQEDAYRINNIYPRIGAAEAIEFLIDFCRSNNIQSIKGRTALFIVPGYSYNILNNIITNFHMPQSTLVLLVSAFLGKNLWRRAYDYALNNEFRFLSYGDSSLLIG